MKLYPQRLNEGYDRLKEPWRGIVAMLVIGPVFFVTDIPASAGCGVLIYAAALGFMRYAYLCKLEFIPSGSDSRKRKAK